ncbi:MAG: HAD family phosphatase [Lachnospiraceae bacterium]|nr:HAD family phosphatase [Lachnospiraceae bacterium]
MIKAVVFDMDGVIFDSEKCVLECWREVADRHNIPDIEEACRECLGINAAATRERMLKRYGEAFPYDEYKKESSALFHEKYDDGRLPKKPGVHELLEYLKQQKIKIALASSTRQEVVLQELRDGGLLNYFDKVVCGDMVKRSKPEPDIFLKACEELQVNPSDAYAVEDSYNGIRAAHAAGMRPIMVPDMAEPTEEMERLSEVVLPSLFEVKQYLQEK